ncbi:hypothetical protein CALCODRAFT_478821 [Calocera cornea HHB12733]|uniref:Pkr1-domain-containing protein n=1 Tax=Calocera cornea HHB12733 TaxID=1353952 RepID=A0A165KBG6_9BASI|nr:hypothetical protein CALCODRAFT_478821 [Calocera cornea HHB12733]
MSIHTAETIQNEVSDTTDQLVSFVSDILTPGSSLRPQFLLALDVVLGFLFFVFVSLFLLTWSLHFLVLMVIVVGLWGSIKFFVAELAKTEGPAPHPGPSIKEATESKKEQ